MIRPTKKAVSLFLGALALFLAGSNIQSGWLYVVGALLLGVVAAGLVVPWWLLRGVRVRRRGPAVSKVGEAVDVHLTFHTRGWRGIFTATDHFLGTDTTLVVQEGRVQERVSHELRARRRGVYEGGDVDLVSGFPFGVGTARRRLWVATPAIVHPHYVELASFPLLEAASVPQEAVHDRRRKGGGLDFYGIREYRPGDSLRHVHWRSTARGGRVLVREFEEHPVSRLGVMIANDQALGEEPDTTLEVSVSVAASLVAYALQVGHPVQLFAWRGSSLEHLFEPGVPEALDWLATLEVDRGSLARTVGGAADHLRSRSTNVVIFPSTRAAATDAPEALAQLQLLGTRAVAVMVSAASFAEQGGTVLNEAEEEALIEEIAATRALVFRVAKELDLSECLREPCFV